MKTGTVSHATLRDVDLIRTFSSYLYLYEGEEGKKDVMEAVARYFGSSDIYNTTDLEKWCPENPEDASYLLHEELFPLMEKYAEKGFYFGATEGDGSDFGYWPTYLSCSVCNWPEIKHQRWPFTEGEDEACEECGWSLTQARYHLASGKNPHVLQSPLPTGKNMRLLARLAKIYIFYGNMQIDNNITLIKRIKVAFGYNDEKPPFGLILSIRIQNVLVRAISFLVKARLKKGGWYAESALSFEQSRWDMYQAQHLLMAMLQPNDDDE